VGVAVSRFRVRAPELTGRGGWLNTAEPLTLAQLRGKIVILDFWTFCCANCLHVLDELRPLEAKYGDVLVVVGVHSPKFAHETDHEAVANAVERYEVRHAVLDDPDLDLWRQYAVRAWPTLVVIDPEGYVVAQAAGEGQVSALDRIVEDLAATHEARGTLHRGDGPYVPPPPRLRMLRFPAKAIALDDSLLVADAGHHQIVELELDGETLRRRIGTGHCGNRDGENPEFAEPNGLTRLPSGDILVADTANHVLRRIAATTTTIGLHVDGVPDVLSPWDVVWWPAIQRVVVAAAGVHLLLSYDPATGVVERLAGTTAEGLKDGPALEGWLAQPSGLAVDGDRLWFVDSETSALRCLDVDGHLHTAVGEGLFDFGHVDGPAVKARLQHPLGVTLLPDKTVAISDTYNGAIRGYDPASDEVTTLARDLAEPSGAVVVGDDLVVVESAAHRLVRPIADATIVLGDSLRTKRPVTDVSADTELRVMFQPPPGRKLDKRYGPASRLSVTASPPDLLRDGTGESTVLERTLRLRQGQGVLHITAQAAACDDDPAIEHPACHVARQDWGVPIRVTPTGINALRLVLLGD
jgi:thiol-disulfide isomerase/thioredoxin